MPSSMPRTVRLWAGWCGRCHTQGRGPAILEACRKIRQEEYPGGLPTGEAVATTGGRRPATYVIHTVGPVYRSCGNRCASLLAASYENSLRQAVELGCRDIAFPAISTGIYGCPKEEAARIAYESVKRFLDKGCDLKVHFIFHSQEDRERFEEAVR